MTIDLKTIWLLLFVIFKVIWCQPMILKAIQEQVRSSKKLKNSIKITQNNAEEFMRSLSCTVQVYFLYISEPNPKLCPRQPPTNHVETREWRVHAAINNLFVLCIKGIHSLLNTFKLGSRLYFCWCGSWLHYIQRAVVYCCWCLVECWFRRIQNLGLITMRDECYMCMKITQCNWCAPAEDQRSSKRDHRTEE